MQRNLIAIVATALLASSLTGMAATEKKVSPAAIAKAHALLKSSASYVVHEPYSQTIPLLYVGYSADGIVEQGIAMRGFKTYEWVTAMIVVKPAGDSLVVADALIPDIDRIKDPDKQNSVLGALKDIKRQVVFDKDAGKLKIDAVTGATRYYNRIYLYCNLMAEALVKEMKAPTSGTLKPTATLKP